MNRQYKKWLLTEIFQFNKAFVTQSFKAAMWQKKKNSEVASKVAFMYVYRHVCIYTAIRTA